MSQTIFPNLGIQIVVGICSQMWLKSMRSSYRLYFAGRKRTTKKSWDLMPLMQKTEWKNKTIQWHVSPGRIDGRIHISIGLGCREGYRQYPEANQFSNGRLSIGWFQNLYLGNGWKSANYPLKTGCWGTFPLGDGGFFFKGKQTKFQLQGCTYTPEN